MELYQVTNKNYKVFYVMASGYNEAVEKVKNHLEQAAESSIVNSDGDLNLKPQEDARYKVECLGELIT